MHFLQIWLLPQERGLSPGYEQKTFADAEKRGRLCLVASSDGRNGSVVIHQDAEIYASILSKREQVEHALPAGRHGWLQVVHGAVELNGQRLRDGDGAAVSGEPVLTVTGIVTAQKSCSSICRSSAVLDRREDTGLPFSSGFGNMG